MKDAERKELIERIKRHLTDALLLPLPDTRPRWRKVWDEAVTRVSCAWSALRGYY